MRPLNKIEIMLLTRIVFVSDQKMRPEIVVERSNLFFESPTMVLYTTSTVNIFNKTVNVV